MKTTVPALPIPGSAEDAQLASWFVERIHILHRQFKEDLESDEYIRTYIVLGNGERIWPNSIGYHNPDAVIIIGKDEAGVETQLITHTSSAQFVMKRYKEVKGEEKTDEQQKGREIGFQTAEGEYST